MNQSLKDQVAIIVGSSSGMGKATAVTFVEAGAKVVLAARRQTERERAYYLYFQCCCAVS